MQSSAHLQGDAQPAAWPELKVVVMGLHWSPRVEGIAAADAANLDALCLLLDGADRVLEMIDPQHPRNGNGSVIHTGDSRDGANRWDDERIFVFLDALPEAVQRVALVVAIASGHAFHEVRGAVCHVSDHASEHEWLRLDLTALAGRRRHTVATLRRDDKEWTIEAGGADFGD